MSSQDIKQLLRRGVAEIIVEEELAKLLRSSNYLVINWSPTPTLSFGSTSYYQVDTRRLMVQVTNGLTVLCLLWIPAQTSFGNIQPHYADQPKHLLTGLTGAYLT